MSSGPGRTGPGRTRPGSAGLLWLWAAVAEPGPRGTPEPLPRPAVDHDDQRLPPEHA